MIGVRREEQNACEIKLEFSEGNIGLVVGLQSTGYIHMNVTEPIRATELTLTLYG
jgi:hypothetical protein